MLPELIASRDLERLGLSRRQLERRLATGEYERIAPGQFMQAGFADDTTAAWIAAAARRPEATLCLLSAASIYDLTDEIPGRTHLAIPRGAKPVATETAPIEWHVFDGKTFSIGQSQHELPGARSIGIYSPERTLIDLFRLRHVWGDDLAIQALKRWLARSESSPWELLTMAGDFPLAKPALLAALEILL
ncbi:type IV toxin-antitoxin system AbiEi family antitoxin domain-containing protein [Leucobacter sp. cx-328]|uniref:type IV toxin-antitoxin system AbiEi family antitoxin domain-containing protein n=1 Tax=unclassified Leucobacter TaxID=2621730 RepID=UPI00165E7B41|nr:MULTISPECIES: type IV toxin-antitoxin system AbiEi family antitoxin domain-containing protein [unclassified Leucobacter]MBC9944769.1 type IV toxin-antitoxin system AbiEi family antitoxin domain-containing protein [Leucobacter sp. cx-328]